MTTDSESMTVTLTDSRTKSLRDSCLALLDPSSPSVTSVRDVAKTVGTILASFPAVTYGVLHNFSFAEDKKAGLKANWGDFDGSMSLSNTSRELEWWISNLPKAYNDIYVSDPKVVLNSDANLQAWGGGGGGVCEGSTAGGHGSLLKRCFISTISNCRWHSLH